ncbi:MAG: deoxyguanosinetriphosphate triphosphohydrolase [Lachnospiraceae bacterium]|nr:deoxyguanosinetriphosphate triphosphohydrolase [Lachnospiraceae bacterium]
MTIREELEEKEKETLSPYAARSAESKGRLNQELPCDIRPAFQRDRDRILHSKAFRRLKDKTQVFLTPEGDHYRTRLTHTLEVSQIARTVAKALDLNVDLTEAIALGHDLGHTPFGHAGERALNRVSKGGFIHAKQSLRVVDFLERDGRGLNLTHEVRDGILNHGTESRPETLEGRIVRLTDKIAYMHHDMDDAIRAGLVRDEDIPRKISSVVGKNLSERLDCFIHDMIIESRGQNDIHFSPPVEEAMGALRKWMFENVYTNPVAKSQEGKAEQLVEALFRYFCDHREELPEEYLKLAVDRGEDEELAVCDHISSMTDRYAIGLYEELFIPVPWLEK